MIRNDVRHLKDFFCKDELFRWLIIIINCDHTITMNIVMMCALARLICQDSTGSQS